LALAEAFRRIILDEVGSTNVEAFAQAAAGDPGPLWVIARRQVAGRGRSGRSWASDPGNLYATLMQRFRCPPMVLNQLSLLTGVATHDAIAAVARPHALSGLRLKWPNDVLIGDAKCVGILSESQQGVGEVVVVMGIGINIATHPENIGRPTTCLRAHGITASPDEMHAALADRTAYWIEKWDEGGNFSALRSAWLERAGPIGEPMSVNTGRERMAGTFLGLDATGALLLRDDIGRQRVVTFGDVSLGLGTDATKGLV
jgi:BirA family transcriptional regulator, biotin operon repressor / biotin---[acetyl-CoA-carboxylase] ligase